MPARRPGLSAALSAPLAALAAATLTTACSAGGQADAPTRDGAVAAASGGASAGNAGEAAALPLAEAPFTLAEAGDFEDPWAIAILPDSRHALVTEQAGRLMLWDGEGTPVAIAGTPAVSYAGQGGLGDVALHPDFAANRMVYLSWAETGAGGKGAAVGVGRLSDDMTRLEDFRTIWRQQPFVDGNGHFGHRIAFGPDGMLYISSGERQKFDPAQDMAANLGKVVRLTDSGGIPADNPWAGEGGVRAQIWALGVRNPLGIAFDGDGRLWELEMGPRGGDELNLVERGGNYGYPRVSNGSHYDGRDIPDHATGDGFVAPLLWWNPSISPSSLIVYRGTAFPAWRGDALIAALGATGVVRADLDGAAVRGSQRWNTGFRVRAVQQDGNGGLWVLEDGGSEGRGRLFRMVPRG